MAVPPSLPLPQAAAPSPGCSLGCALRCTRAPVAWRSGGGAILPACGPTSTSCLGQSSLRALSLPFPALC